MMGLDNNNDQGGTMKRVDHCAFHRIRLNRLPFAARRQAQAGPQHLNQTRAQSFSLLRKTNASG